MIREGAAYLSTSAATLCALSYANAFAVDTIEDLPGKVNGSSIDQFTFAFLVAESEFVTSSQNFSRHPPIPPELHMSAMHV